MVEAIGRARRRSQRSEIGAVALGLASILVGIAIALDGAAARGINGLGGLLWIGASVVLFVVPRTRRERVRVATVATGMALVLVVWARPFDVVSAVPGFLAAGIVVGSVARERPVAAALLVPALWLPVHLLVAIGKAIARAATDGTAAVRTDPPPTAAVVPLAMVAAAALGGMIAVWWRGRRGEGIEGWSDSRRREGPATPTPPHLG